MLPKRYNYPWLRRLRPILDGLRELIPPELGILRAFPAFVSSLADQAQQQYADDRLEDLAEHTEGLIGDLAKELAQLREHVETVTEEELRAARITPEQLGAWREDLAEVAEEAAVAHEELVRQLAMLSQQLREHDEGVRCEIKTMRGHLEALTEAMQAGTPPVDLTVRAPEPYLRDVSSLPEHWTGRQAEMDELDAWLRAEDDPMCCLLAMGGTGKSTLSWSWLDRRVAPAQEELGLEGIFQCSFYEGELSFERFLSELTAYLGLPLQDDPVTALTQQLLDRPLLLVLDGFERLLQAYASADAALTPERAEDELEAWDRRCSDWTVVRLLQGASSRGRDQDAPHQPSRPAGT